MDEKTIRGHVQQFFERYAAGRTADDAFPAWWLHQTFDVPPADAVACSSTGSYDHGLDAFHLELVDGRDPTLHLIQAKLSPSRSMVRDGVRGFKRTLERVSHLLRGEPTPTDVENTVWTRLAARLSTTPNLGRVVVHCRVIHLVNADSEALLAEARAERADFEEIASVALPDHKVLLSLSGPLEIVPRGFVVPPSARRTLAFDGVEAGNAGARLFIGLGTLADLVQLYAESGDYLFSKNVRSFNFRAAERNGPAHHVRATLRRMCVDDPKKRQDPLHFTLFHNGVSLHATRVERGDGQTLVVRNPAILNGCQTVKSAWNFRNDRLLKERIDDEAWRQIRVPLRVVETNDEELVRRITVSNNRQTAIRPSAFRANDPLQLQLGDRLRAAGIYYERQEDAFANLRKSEPRTIETLYANSFAAPLSMEELAQAIAVAALEPAVSVASKVSELFDDPAYGRLFSEQRLASLQLLVFLSNLLRCLHLALKDAKEKSAKLEPMTPGTFKYPVARALARWIVKHESGLVSEFGREVIFRPGTSHPLRDRLRRLISPQNTGLQTLVPELWATGDKWRSPNDREAVEPLLRKLHVHEFDVFERYREPA